MSLNFTNPQPSLPQDPTPMTPAITKDEATMFHDILTRVANVLVQASDFSAKVNELQSRAAEVEAELTRIRNANVMLDETIVRLREERNEAQREADEAKRLRMEAERDLTVAHESKEADIKLIQSLSQELADTRRERDDYGMKNLQLEEDLTKVNAKLAKFKSLFDDEAKPELKASTPIASIEPTSVPAPEPILAPDAITTEPTGADLSFLPSAASVPTPQAERRIYPGDIGYDFTKAICWDKERCEYYMIAHD